MARIYTLKISRGLRKLRRAWSWDATKDSDRQDGEGIEEAQTFVIKDMLDWIEEKGYEKLNEGTH